MSDVRTILERGVGGATPPPDPFERLLRRRDRRRRNQRIMAGTVAFAVFVVAIWIVTSGDPVDRDRGIVPVQPPDDRTSIEPTRLGTITQSETQCVFDPAEDPLPAGAGSFTVVNGTGSRVAFGFFELPRNLTYEEFESAVDRERRLAERGKPFAAAAPGNANPLFGIEVRPDTSETFDAVLSAGIHAVVCLHRYEGVGMRPFDLVGPLVVTGSL